MKQIFIHLGHVFHGFHNANPINDVSELNLFGGESLVDNLKLFMINIILLKNSIFSPSVFISGTLSLFVSVFLFYEAFFFYVLFCLIISVVVGNIILHIGFMGLIFYCLVEKRICSYFFSI